MNFLKNTFIISERRNLYKLFSINVIIIVIMTVLSKGNFLSLRNFNFIFGLSSELGILSIGIMLAMIVGGIDLSIVATANLCGVVAAMVMLNTSRASIFLGVLTALLIAVACGSLNGYLVSYIGIHPILVTLGSFQLFQGVAVAISKGYAVVNFSETMVEFMNSGILKLIPFNFLLFLGIILVLSFMLNHTRFGQSMYLIGANYKASKYSGIPSQKYLFTVYVIIALLAAVAGLIISGKTNSAKADYGSSYILQTILICLLGGVNWTGGKGKISEVILALFSLQFLNSGFGMMRFSNFFMNFFSGFFLLFILILNYYLAQYENKIIIKKQ